MVVLAVVPAVAGVAAVRAGLAVALSVAGVAAAAAAAVAVVADAAAVEGVLVVVVAVAVAVAVAAAVAVVVAVADFHMFGVWSINTTGGTQDPSRHTQGCLETTVGGFQVS